MSNPAKTRLDTLLIRRAERMAAGLRKVVLPKPAVTIDGATLTQGQFLARVQAILELFRKVEETRALLRQQLIDREEGAPAARRFVSAAAATLRSEYGPDSAALQSFGLLPPKERRQRSSGEIALSAALGQRTRAKHGYKSKRELEAIDREGKPGLILGPDGRPVAPEPAPKAEPVPARTTSK